MQLIGSWRRVALLVVAIATIGSAAWWLMIRMPGGSSTATVISSVDANLRDELMADVQKLAGDIGERNELHYAELKAAARKREQTARPKPNRLIESGSKTEPAKSRGENNSR